MDLDRARELHARGYAAFEAQDWATAGEALAALGALDPEPGPAAQWWFDAALAAKFARDWPAALIRGREAAAGVPRGEGEAAFWNLGIAATALGDWATARDAWSGFGITLPAGDGPVHADLGRACVRLATADVAEVVWVDRLCLARGRVISVPVDADRRFGDVVLHDGEPVGRRELDDGRSFPVFDEIAVLERSDTPTTTVTVTGDASDVAALDDLFFEHDGALETSGSIQLTCRWCSEGTLVTPGQEHHAGRQQVRVAATPELTRELLDRWRATRPEHRAHDGD